MVSLVEAAPNWDCARIGGVGGGGTAGVKHDSKRALGNLLSTGVWSWNDRRMMLNDSRICDAVTLAGKRFAWLNRSLVAATGVLSWRLVCCSVSNWIVDGLFYFAPNLDPR